MSVWKKSLAIAALLSSTLLFADEFDENSEIIDLDAYTVSASKVALPMGSVGSSITVLAEADTSRFAADMVTESLRHVSGLYLRNSGNIGSAPGITMRGLPIAPVVLIDGIEVNTPGNGDVFNFGNLPVAAVESIEVLRGAQSALYGANALTGVISITTKNGKSLEPSFAVGASYGSRNSVNAYATASQATDRINYFVSVNFNETDGYSVQDRSFGPEWEDDDMSRNLFLMGKFGFLVTERLDLIVFASHLDSKSEYDPGIPNMWTVAAFENYSEKEQDLIQLKLDFDISDDFDLTASVSYNDTTVSALDGWGVRDSQSDLLKCDLLSHYRLTDSYEIVGGLELEQASDGIGDYEMDTVSVFVENLIELAPNLNVTIAARFDDNDTFGEESTYRGSISYLLEDFGLQLKASIGTSFDAPEVSQLFGTWGNPDLKAEDGSSYDLGFEQELLEGDLVWGLNYFSIIMDDHIEYLRSTFNYANVDWESKGIESFVRWSATDSTNVQLSHSFANAERKKVADDVIFHSPEHQFSLLLDQAFMEEDLIASVTVHYVGDRETWDGATDSYITVDLAARYKISEMTECWVRIENLFDETYQEIRGYSSPGLGGFVGVNFQF